MNKTLEELFYLLDYWEKQKCLSEFRLKYNLQKMEECIKAEMKEVKQ